MFRCDEKVTDDFVRPRQSEIQQKSTTAPSPTREDLTASASSASIYSSGIRKTTTIFTKIEEVESDGVSPVPTLYWPNDFEENIA